MLREILALPATGPLALVHDPTGEPGPGAPSTCIIHHRQRGVAKPWFLLAHITQR